MGVALAAPAAFSVMMGALVLGWQCLKLLNSPVWQSISAQDALGVLGLKITASAIATGFLGFDKIVWSLLADAPLVLWLGVILPSLWMLLFGALFMGARLVLR